MPSRHLPPVLAACLALTLRSFLFAVVTTHPNATPASMVVVEHWFEEAEGPRADEVAASPIETSQLLAA